MIATALLRKSEFHPEPVICVVFTETNKIDRQNQIHEWKKRFVEKYPEFQNSLFTEVDVVLL